MPKEVFVCDGGCGLEEPPISPMGEPPATWWELAQGASVPFTFCSVKCLSIWIEDGLAPIERSSGGTEA